MYIISYIFERTEQPERSRGMKKILTVILTVLFTASVSSVTFAEEGSLADTTLDEYCGSEDFSMEGLQKLFPEYYAECQEAYAQDAAQIKEIEDNLDEMLAEGRIEAANDVKRNEAEPLVYTYPILGSIGDIIVELEMDSGSFGFAGHAAIVSTDSDYTVESYAKSFSPKGIDGVQYYENQWGWRAGALLIRPKNISSSVNPYRTAAQFAESKVDLPYNKNFFNKKTTSKYYCSQLVWQAWLAAGIDIEKGTVPNGMITPADIVNSSNTYIAAKVPD